MDKQVVSNFRFDDYKVDYIQYKYNPEFDPNEELKIELVLDFKVTVSADTPKGTVTLIANFFKKTSDKNYPFNLVISITGYFSIDTECVDSEKLKNFIEVNGTTALFPFLRTVVADVTKAANVQPLIMPLFNIYSLVKEKKKEEDTVDK